MTSRILRHGPDGALVETERDRWADDREQRAQARRAALAREVFRGVVPAVEAERQLLGLVNPSPNWATTADPVTGPADLRQSIEQAVAMMRANGHEQITIVPPTPRSGTSVPARLPTPEAQFRGLDGLMLPPPPPGETGWTVYRGQNFRQIWPPLSDNPRPQPAPTEEELAARRRAAEEATRARELKDMAHLEALGRRHTAVLDRCGDWTLREVAAFHGPDGMLCPDCQGCDDDWPCATFRLIEAAVHPDAPERQEARDGD